MVRLIVSFIDCVSVPIRLTRNETNLLLIKQIITELFPTKHGIAAFEISYFSSGYFKNKFKKSLLPHLKKIKSISDWTMKGLDIFAGLFVKRLQWIELPNGLTSLSFFVSNESCIKSIIERYRLFTWWNRNNMLDLRDLSISRLSNFILQIRWRFLHG